MGREGVCSGSLLERCGFDDFLHRGYVGNAFLFWTNVRCEVQGDGTSFASWHFLPSALLAEKSC